MKRLHLFQFEDPHWVPAGIRDGGTDLLDVLLSRGFYDKTHAAALELLKESRARHVLDAGSGGGRGALTLRRAALEAGLALQWTLSDLYPNEGGMARVRALNDPAISYRTVPLNVTQVPPDAADAVTMFSAMHHFQPEALRALIAATVRQGLPLCFVDTAASPAIRKMPVFVLPFAFAINFTILTLVSLFVTVLVCPVKPISWLLTCIGPLIPLLFAWAGTVSALRCYNADEMLEIALSVPGSSGYTWNAGTGGLALYLTGLPIPESPLP